MTAVHPHADPRPDVRFASIERSFPLEHPFVWLLTLVGPFVLTAVLLGMVYAIAGPEYARTLVVMAIAAMWLFGRLIILGGSDPDVAQVTGSLSSLELFAMVLYLDVAVAMVLTFHLGFLFKLPLIGRKLQALIVDSRFILSRHQWIRRATFLGLVAFVMFPLAATGSVGGSIFGRLLGLSRLSTFLGILTGSLLGNGIMLAASDLLSAHLDKNHPLVKYGGLAAVLLIVLILESRYRRLRHQFEHHVLPRSD